MFADNRSVIDEATQFFIAEGTKTVDLVDGDIYGPGDSLWMGCDSVDKAGRLCERYECILNEIPLRNH